MAAGRPGTTLSRNTACVETRCLDGGQEIGSQTVIHRMKTEECHHG
jgi:hypothetical protein